MAAGDDKKLYEHMGEVKAMAEAHGDQLNNIHAELRDMNANFAEYNSQLAVHIKRTELNEKALKETADLFETRLKPVEKHVTVVSAYWKALVILGALPACAYYIIKIVQEVSK